MSEYTLPVPKAAPAAASAKKVALTDATTVYELYRVRFRGREREGEGGQGREGGRGRGREMEGKGGGRMGGSAGERVSLSDNARNAAPF